MAHFKGHFEANRRNEETVHTCCLSAFPRTPISQKDVTRQSLNGRGKSGETKMVRTLSETDDFLFISTVKEGNARMGADRSCGFLERRSQNPRQTLGVRESVQEEWGDRNMTQKKKYITRRNPVTSNLDE